MEQRFRQAFIVGISLSTLLGLIIPFFAPVDGDDATTHLHWITAFFDLLRQGILVPTWLPDGFHGLGAPTFYFYPPLTYYVTSSIIGLTGILRPETVYNIAGLFSTVASGAACYYLLRKLDGSKRDAVLGSLLYAFAPYRLFDLYTRSSLSQPMAFIFVPLVIAGLVECLDPKRGLRPSITLALSWACLLLTSLPLAVAMAILIVVIVALGWKSLRWMTLVSAAFGVALGTALSLYHYLPALHFQQFIQSTTYWNPGGHQRDPGNWLPALLSRSELTFVVQALIIFCTHAAILVLWWRLRRSGDRTQATMIVGLVVLFFLMIEIPYLNLPIWSYLPPFKIVQFHIRFGIFSVLLVSLLVGSVRAGEQWKVFATRLGAIWSWSAVGLSLLVLFSVRLHPHGASVWMDSAEYLPVSNLHVESAVQKAFLPHLHDEFLLATPEFGDAESTRLLKSGALTKEYALEVRKPHLVTLHQFAWPEWKLDLDGSRVESATDSIGRAVVAVGVGAHRLSIHLERASIETTGFWISGISLMLLLLTGRIGKKNVVSPA